jgi:hypothetical protein
MVLSRTLNKFMPFPGNVPKLRRRNVKQVIRYFSVVRTKKKSIHSFISFKGTDIMPGSALGTGVARMI